jgi:tripartite-type tricarboxylate transporter receptor subunit TctC
MFSISFGERIPLHLRSIPAIAVNVQRTSGGSPAKAPSAALPRRTYRARSMVLAVLFGASVDAASFDMRTTSESPYPNRAIRLIVVYTPGGLVDLVARIVGSALADQLLTAVVVENKAGAGGRIGVEAVIKAAADGYTLGLGTTGPLAIEPALDPSLAYDPRRDIAAVSLIASAPQTLVINAGVPASSVRELIAYARTYPGKLNYASPGIGTTGHLAGALFKTVAEVDIVHVPYKGNQEALKDVVAGRVQLIFSPLATVLPFVKDGKLRVLAVAGYARSALMPEVPTMAEAGVPGAEAVAWYGLIAPRGTPPAVIHRLHTGLANALARADVRDQLLQLGAEPTVSTPEAFADLIRDQMIQWRSIVVRAGLRPRE